MWWMSLRLILFHTFNRSWCATKIYRTVVWYWYSNSVRETGDTIGFRQQLSTTSFEAYMWAGDHGELFFCIHLNREWQVHAKSNELTDAFLGCHPDWAQDPSLLRDKCGLPLPGSGTIIPVLWLLFSRLSMLQSFQPLSGNSLNSLRAPYCFDG